MRAQIVPDHETWRAVLTLILASLVIMGSPGPSTISATAVGAAYGFRRSLAYVGGLILGTTLVLFAVAVGVIAIVLSIPHGASALDAISTIYIAYLAWRIATAPPLTAGSDLVAAPALAGGVLLAIANPKAYLAIASVFARATILKEDHALDAMVKTALLGTMIVAIHLFWLSAGSSLSRLLKDPVRSRIVNIGLAALLIAATALAIWR